MKAKGSIWFILLLLVTSCITSRIDSSLIPINGNADTIANANAKANPITDTATVITSSLPNKDLSTKDSANANTNAKTSAKTDTTNVITSSLPNKNKSIKDSTDANTKVNAKAIANTDTATIITPSLANKGKDSLQLAIEARNKAVDDSIRADSINKRQKNTIESPVIYSGNDSLVYNATTGMAYLYGGANVKYQNMDLSADIMDMNNSTNTVHAMGRSDSTKAVSGKPIFKQGADEYKSDTISYNFKSQKGYINNVYTAQQDGFITSEEAKRSQDGLFYMKHGRYTTCDLDHPDFYLALSRAKIKPGKEVFFGPAYMVVADVPLPLAIPYGFFPFTESYSSGIIMPTYGDETDRGFYLRDGGYYFAVSDIWDLKLIGEIYTKGSWGITASSNYRKRYKYSGSFLFSYQNSQTGEKNMPDYGKTTSFKVQWSHRQDSKANPYNSLSASVNFASSKYEKNNLTSMYSPQAMTQSTRTSSVSYSTGFSSIGMSLSTTMNVTQNMRDSSVAMTLPDLNVSISRFYPLRRKHMVGKERWYEKIAMSYTGQLSNSINTQEDKFFKSNIIKDWKNAIQHRIPVSASFTLFNYINLSPSFNFTDRMYSNKTHKQWSGGKEVTDTVYGFYNVYNWDLSMSMNTKLYGFYVPNRKIFGDKIVAVRHVLTPSVSFSYAPDFSSSRYGYYETYTKTDAEGNVELVEYSPYANGMYGVPGKGKTGSLSFDLSNNVEMKVRSDKDTSGYRKISIIDELGLSMSYNMAATEKPWSDLSARIRLKLSKSYTFSMNAVFATYAYEIDEKTGKPYVGNRTEYECGRFGRFQGMSQNLSYTFNNQTFSKLADWITGKRTEETDVTDRESDEEDVNTNEDPVMNNARKTKSGGDAHGMAETDGDGYMKFSMPWSLSVSYGITMRENTSGEFNTSSMRYPYSFTQNMNFSGNITISKGWNISFSSGWDFENQKISMTTASLSRDLHCFAMSCSVVISPYTSYNFSFRCNAATLTDALKYDKRSSYSNNIKWY